MTGLPANVDAEKTILGAILLDNAAHSEAAEKLESEDFSLDSHKRIFLRMTELMNAQRAVDIVTLANELSRYKEIESVGGVAYLASLTEGLPRRPVIEEYIRIVKDKSLLRKLMAICSSAIAPAPPTRARRRSRCWARPSRSSWRSRRRASRTASSRWTRSSRTPSGQSTICISRAARSLARHYGFYGA